MNLNLSFLLLTCIVENPTKAYTILPDIQCQRRRVSVHDTDLHSIKIVPLNKIRKQKLVSLYLPIIIYDKLGQIYILSVIGAIFVKFI